MCTLLVSLLSKDPSRSVVPQEEGLVYGFCQSLDVRLEWVLELPGSSPKNTECVRQMIYQLSSYFCSISKKTTVSPCHQSYLQRIRVPKISPSCSFPPSPLPALGHATPSQPLTHTLVLWSQCKTSSQDGQGVGSTFHRSLLLSLCCPLIVLEPTAQVPPLRPWHHLTTALLSAIFSFGLSPLAATLGFISPNRLSSSWILFTLFAGCNLLCPPPLPSPSSDFSVNAISWERAPRPLGWFQLGPNPHCPCFLSQPQLVSLTALTTMWAGYAFMYLITVYPHPDPEPLRPRCQPGTEPVFTGCPASNLEDGRPSLSIF